MSSAHRGSQAAAAAWLAFNERSLIESSNCGPRLGTPLRPRIHPYFLWLLCVSKALGGQGRVERGHPTRNIGTTWWAPTGAPLPSAAVIQPPACQSSHAACLRNAACPGPQYNKAQKQTPWASLEFLLYWGPLSFQEPSKKQPAPFCPPLPSAQLSSSGHGGFPVVPPHNPTFGSSHSGKAKLFFVCFMSSKQ